MYWRQNNINCSKCKKINILILSIILCSIIQVQCWCRWWIIRNRQVQHWCRWLRLRLRRWLWYYNIILNNNWISLKTEWLRWRGLWDVSRSILLCWLRLLGCEGLTPSWRRRLDSWLGHLLKKLFNAHNRPLVDHILQTLHDQELALMQALQHR